MTDSTPAQQTHTPAPAAEVAGDSAHPAQATAQPPDEATSPEAQAAANKARERARSRRKLGIVAIAAAVGGMALGGTVEYFVGSAIDATGCFGATIDTVIEQQKANFDDIRAKLDALNKAPPGSPEAVKLQGDLQKLLTEQQKLTEKTHDEMRQFQQEVTRLRGELLEKKGMTTGADFWLGARESITLHERGVAFAVTAIYQNGNTIGVTLAGKPHQMRTGDYLTFPRSDGKGDCKVIYKIGTIRSDGRVGFDLVCE